MLGKTSKNAVLLLNILSKHKDNRKYESLISQSYRDSITALTGLKPKVLFQPDNLEDF